MSGQKIVDAAPELTEEAGQANPLRSESSPKVNRQTIYAQRRPVPVADAFSQIVGEVSIEADLDRVAIAAKRLHYDANTTNIRNIPSFEFAQVLAAFKAQCPVGKEIGFFDYQIKWNQEGIDALAKQMKTPSKDPFSFQNAPKEVQPFLKARREQLSSLISTQAMDTLEELETALYSLELKNYDGTKAKQEANATYGAFMRLPAEQRQILTEAYDALAKGLGVGAPTLAQALEKHDIKGFVPASDAGFAGGPALAQSQNKIKDDVEAASVAEKIVECFGEQRGWGAAKGYGVWTGWLLNDKEPLLFTLLDQAYTTEDKKKITEQFKKKCGVELKDQIESSQSSAEAEYALALLGDNQARADALGFFYAIDGIGTENDTARRILRHMNLDDFKNACEEFKKRYGQGQDLGKWLTGDIKVETLNEWTAHWQPKLDWKKVAEGPGTVFPE